METHFHDKLGAFLNTPIAKYKGSRMTYLDAADEMFIRYDENNVTPLPDQLKVTFLKQAVLTDEHLKTIYGDCFNTKQKLAPANKKVIIDYEEYRMKLRNQAEALDNQSNTNQNSNNSMF